jgi:hypothetical protein
VDKLNGDVVGFQALAKGWMARKEGKKTKVVIAGW